MEVTDITRRNIIDDLRLNFSAYHGRLDELAFLKRIYDLSKLESTDGRFDTFEGDYWQHRVNNYDWPDDWFFEDSRFSLMQGEDSAFLRFLCETLHPLVRPNSEEAQTMLEMYNSYLMDDGYELYTVKKQSNRNVYSFRKIGSPAVKFGNIEKVGREFIKEQLSKCEQKLALGDYDGAITNARSLVEDVIVRDIHKQLTGKEMESKGDLINDYKAIKKMLNLVENSDLDNSFKQVTSGLSSIVNGLSSIANKMGDRHSQSFKPLKHHVKLAINSAMAVTDFLYDVLEYQKTRTQVFKQQLLALPHIRFGKGSKYGQKYKSLSDREEIINVPEYKNLLSKCDKYMMRLVLNELLHDFTVTCYNDADRLFINLTCFYEILTPKDIQILFAKTATDSQAVANLHIFLADLQDSAPSLLNSETEKFLNPSSDYV